MRKTIPLEDRFWAKVERRSPDECWLWTGASVVSRGGLRYGKIYVDGKLQLAHRTAFYLQQGRWPAPNALHGCDNSLCCNAENSLHIHEGTPKDNTREMFQRGRHSGPPVLLGERANRSRLSDIQAQEIYDRFHALPGDISQQTLATEYGVSQHAVSYIVRGLRRSLQ